MATDTNGVVLGAIPPGVPHLAIPFGLDGNGSALVLEQDTSAEIVQSVAMCVGTVPGTRLMVPSYGMPDPTFSGVSPALLESVVGQWEKRASVGVALSPGGIEQVTVAVKGGS